MLDTEWKLLDVSLGSSKDKYGLSQTDFYQLFAYGHRYLAANRRMLLIYPMTPRFNGHLSTFTYPPELHLSVVPFDLGNGCIAAASDEVLDTSGMIGSA